MKVSIKVLALVGLVASASQAFTFKALDFDAWGVNPAGSSAKSANVTAVLAPETDMTSTSIAVGGHTNTTGTSWIGGTAAGGDVCMGPCSTTAAGGTANWSIATAQDLTSQSLKANTHVYDYVMSSATAWGWANTGWWVIPNVDQTKEAANTGTWFDIAKPMGLTSSSVVHVGLNYPAGKTLTLQLNDPTLTDLDANGPPRATITGTGGCKDYPVSASSFVRRGGTFSIANATALGLLRIESGSAAGQQYSGSTSPVALQVFGVSSDAAIGCSPVLGSVATAALNIVTNSSAIVFNNVQSEFAAQLINSNGQVVKASQVSAANNSLNIADIQQGVYFVKAVVDGQNLSQKVVISK